MTKPKALSNSKMGPMCQFRAVDAIRSWPFLRKTIKVTNTSLILEKTAAQQKKEWAAVFFGVNSTQKRKTALKTKKNTKKP